MRFISYRLLAMLFGVLVSGNVSAHGGVAVEFDTCISQLGKYRLHFTAYMTGEGTEYCWDLPVAGKAIMVFDLQEPEMRRKPIEFRVVETGEEGDVAAAVRTLIHLEPTTYPTGTFNAEANFEEGKQYMAVVTIADARPLVLKAPIRVASGGAAKYVLLIGALVVATGVVGVLKWRQRSQSAAKT